MNAPLLSVKLSLYWYVKSQKSQKCSVVFSCSYCYVYLWARVLHSAFTVFVNQFDFVIFIFFFLDKSLGSFTLLQVIFAAMVIGDFG